MTLNLREISQKIIQCVGKYAANKFTGQLTFQLDMRDGGIGNCILEIKQRDADFKKNLQKA